MQCVEDEKQAKYKCPACKSPYCSVLCFKSHKLKCTSPQNEDTELKNKRAEEVKEDAAGLTENPQFSRIFKNERVKALLSSEGVQKHLKLLYEIMNDPNISGENNSEGRRIVALKKLRELRKGGREGNEAIEELVCEVTKLWEEYSDEH